MPMGVRGFLRCSRSPSFIRRLLPAFSSDRGAARMALKLRALDKVYTQVRNRASPD